MLLLRAVGQGRFERARSETWAARAALGFVVAAALSAVLALRPTLAVVGLYQQFDGLLFFVALAGCWALGTALGAADRRLLESAIIAGALVNAIVAVLQQLVGLGAIGLPDYSNVPDGLLGNPVYLGGLLAGALPLVAHRYRTNRRSYWLAVVLIGVALGLCTERLPALLAVAVVLVELWFAFGPALGRRTEATAHRPAVEFALLTVGSLLAGSLFGKYRGGAGGVTQNLAGSSAQETYGQRFAAWRAAFHAFVHHPLLGYGPGQTRQATTPFWPLSEEMKLPSTYFSDAHNILIEVATTVGIIGLILFVGWLVLGFRHRRGPLIGVVLVILVTELAEPLNVGLTPIAFLALGAAALVLTPAVEDSERPPPSWARRGALVAALLALVPAIMLLVGDGETVLSNNAFSVAQDSAALSRANTAETLLSPWPGPATNLGAIHLYLSLGGNKSQTADAIYWDEVAVARDPGNAPLRVNLANALLYGRHGPAALAQAKTALGYVPTYSPAMNVIATVLYQRSGLAAARPWYQRSLIADPNQPGVRAILAGKCAPRLPGGRFNLNQIHCVG
jgi:O-antigen ligase